MKTNEVSRNGCDGQVTVVTSVVTVVSRVGSRRFYVPPISSVISHRFSSLLDCCDPLVLVLLVSVSDSWEIAGFIRHLIFFVYGVTFSVSTVPCLRDLWLSVKL